MQLIAFVFMADVHVFQVEANRQVFSTETQMINNLFVLTALTPASCIPLLTHAAALAAARKTFIIRDLRIPINTSDF